MRSPTVSCVGLACVIILSVSSFAQLTIEGKNQLTGRAQAGAPSMRYVQVMALLPPSASSPDNSNFRTYVMTQASVDGVTLNIDWSQVENTTNLSTPCAVGTDVCQQDSVGQYHTYNWSAYDTRSGSTGIYSWFDLFGGVRKKVNFTLSGINGGPTVDTATPWYVTSTGYLANFNPPRQDVVNRIVNSSCANSMPWPGLGSQQSVTFTYIGSSTVKVTSSSCCGGGSTSLLMGDTIWVTGGSSPSGTLQYNTPIPGGVQISKIDDANTFEYPTTGPGNPTSSTCSACSYITTSQSSPAPYEQPYVAAWEAFIAAANLHFSPNYQAWDGTHWNTVGSAGFNQLGYVRSGTWSGGESFVYCSAALTALSAPYNYSSPTTWLNDYQSKVNYVQSLGPTMMRYWPIDNGTAPDSMAVAATGAGNGYGFVNGFGSQGLSLYDKLNPSGCNGAVADWCHLFGAVYRSNGMPLELQQISISDETNTTCTPTCGTPPNSAGDLRLWLPFAVSNGATVFEMYYLDLALAFDANYCTSQSGGVCMTGYAYNPAFMTRTQQATWYNDVGLGNPNCVSGGSGVNCYSTTINGQHGWR